MLMRNRHFPSWKIKVLPPVTLPATPRLFPNPKRLQAPDSADRSRQRPRNQLFIPYVGVCIPYPAVHETTIYFLTPLADSIPGFWKEGLEDMDMRARRVILDRLEWSATLGGRVASKSAPGNAGWSDTIQMCLCRHRALSLLAPMFIS